MANEKQNSESGDEKTNTQSLTGISTQTLTKSLEANIQLLKNIFSEDELLVVRRFQNRYLSEANCCVLYFEEMARNETINDNIIKPVLNMNLSENISVGNLLEELKNKTIASDKIEVTGKLDEAVDSLIRGETVFLLEGYDKLLIIESQGWKSRSISEPESSRVVRGPREGFTEAIKLNISLLRRRINSPDLKFKFKYIGERTRTRTCICYIKGIASEGILKEFENRLDKIDIDGILDSGYIQELIRDAPFSPFETVGYSERPDTVASKLLEGRIALIVDGSPFVLTVPFVMVENTQSSEDYYNNYFLGTFNRLIRNSSMILSITVPSLYLAVVTFHQEMLPTPLLMSVSSGRQNVPFPTVVSLIVMLLIFDLLREAGTRMPKPIGQAINLVGTLILGQALSEAKLVSPHVIIISALSGILSLMNITMLGATIIIRTMLLLFTSILGIYGCLFGVILVNIHTMTLRSFGVPYMINFSTLKDHNFQDVWIRVPWWEMTLRPKVIAAKNLVRQSQNKNKQNSK